MVGSAVNISQHDVHTVSYTHLDVYKRQVLNHNLYFTQFSPNGSGEPTGKLAEAIKSTWGCTL